MKRTMFYFLWGLFIVMIIRVEECELLVAPICLSLKESVKITLLYNADVVNVRLNEKIQNQQKNLYITEVFPQVKYNIQTIYFSRIQKIFLLDFIIPTISRFLAQKNEYI